MRLTASESEFWQRVYVAAISKGYTESAARVADTAVERWRSRTEQAPGYRDSAREVGR